MRKTLPVAFLSSAVLCLGAFGGMARSSGANQGADHGGDVELAPFMSQLQTFSQKLGYAIAAKNGPLARFYLHEVDEVLEEVAAKVPVHDGHQIAAMIKATVEPAVRQLKAALQEGGSGGTWAARQKDYVQLMNTCNTCHQATAHGFIHILPSRGTPPFNQRFAPVDVQQSPAKAPK